MKIFWDLVFMETTFLLIRCEQGTEKSTIEKLRGFRGISECRETIGTFDIIAKLEQADETIASTILRMPEVRKVTSLVCHRSIPMLVEAI